MNGVPVKMRKHRMIPCRITPLEFVHQPYVYMGTSIPGIQQQYVATGYHVSPI
jgi:hypothetical protein